MESDKPPEKVKSLADFPIDDSGPPPEPIPPEILAELEEAVRYAMSGVRDPERMRRACERMDRMREELYRRHGLLNVAVDLIHDGRDEE
jgi:hypothetical protein